MPAFLVSLPDEPGKGFHEGNRQVVFAADQAGALLLAQSAFDGDANAMWAAATATEIVAGTVLTGYEFTVNVFGGATTGPISATAKAGPLALALASAVVGAAPGATYADDEIATVVGGVFTRAATFRVVAQTAGAVDTVEMEDPGEYTVLPTLDEMVTTGGGDGNLTLDGTASAIDAYEVFLGQLVTLLNGHADIAAAKVEFSEALLGPRLFTVAAAGDAIGDATVQLVFSRNSGAHMAQLSSTITDQGAGGAALSFAIPATPVPIPGTPVVLKG